MSVLVTAKNSCIIEILIIWPCLYLYIHLFWISFIPCISLAILHWIPTIHLPISIRLTHTEVRSCLCLQTLPYSHLHNDTSDVQIYSNAEPRSITPLLFSRVCSQHSMLKFILLENPLHAWISSVPTSLWRSKNKNIEMLDLCIAAVTWKSH